MKTDIPWVEKYRPKSIKEMALPSARVEGHRVNLAEELTNFIKNFFKEIKSINDKNKKSSVLKAVFRGKMAFYRSYILRMGFLDGVEGYLCAKNIGLGAYLKYLKCVYDETL